MARHKSPVPGSLLRGLPETTRTWIEAMFREHEAMRQAIACLEDKNERLLAMFREAEQRRLVLTSQYVAAVGLIRAHTRAAAISVIEDILVNLIGCEKAAIFEVDAERRELVLLASIGVEPLTHRTIPMGAGVIGATALTGKLYMAGEGDPAEIAACVPLLRDGEARGAVALFRLLSHKPGLTPADLTLLELLEAHAAYAWGMCHHVE